jgi:hypothetical protein
MLDYWGLVRKRLFLDHPEGHALIRFRPPRAPLTSDLRWVLARAFETNDLAELPAPSPGLAVELSRRLDLSPRIAARNDPALLARDLGSEAARTFTAVRGVAQMTADRLGALARDVAAIAATIDVPIVLLKGAALHATGRIALGARWAGDVDVLVPEAALERMSVALRSQGFRESIGVLDCEHQLPALERGDGEVVELHRFLPGVSRPGERRFATLEILESAGALRRVPGWPTGTRVPDIHVLAAHALVHGIAQHGLSPHSYPLTRMLADLIDLGAAGAEGGALMVEAHAWTAHHVTDEEAQAGHATVVALANGRPENSALLDHVLAGLLDDDYAASLKLRALGSGPSRSPRFVAVAREAWRAVFPGRERLAGLSPGTSPGVAALARPFVVAARAARALTGVR